MIDYKDFVVPDFYWDYFVKEKKSLFINSYLRENNILPSEDMIKNFIIDNEEREDFRRMLYSKYCVSGIIPESPDVPEIPGEDVIIPNNPNSGNSGDNIVIPESSGNTVYVMFDIDMEDIPETVGVENNIVNTIFKQGILNGDLLDKSIVDITLRNNGTKIKINDLSQIYNIPIGEYNVTGTIGEVNNEQSNEKCYLVFNHSISINKNGNITLLGTFESNIVLSNSHFTYGYEHRNFNTIYYGGTVYYYVGYYYTFINRFVGGGSIYYRRFTFDNIKYEIQCVGPDDQWIEGSSYYYDYVNEE